jgi:hypothetical protein
MSKMVTQKTKFTFLKMEFCASNSGRTFQTRRRQPFKSPLAMPGLNKKKRSWKLTRNRQLLTLLAMPGQKTSPWKIKLTRRRQLLTPLAYARLFTVLVTLQRDARRRISRWLCLALKTFLKTLTRRRQLLLKRFMVTSKLLHVNETKVGYFRYPFNQSLNFSLT